MLILRAITELDPSVLAELKHLFSLLPIHSVYQPQPMV